MNEFDQIEAELIFELNTFVEYCKRVQLQSNSKWTNQLKKQIAELGERRELKVSVGGFKDVYNSEWLYDLVWYKEEGTGKDARLSEVFLVAESEWTKSFEHIRYDFQKLLVANANNRLMICEVNKHEIEYYKQYFTSEVKTYKSLQCGSRFLIAMLVYNEHHFHYELILK